MKRNDRLKAALACLVLAMVLTGCSATSSNWVPGIYAAERISAVGTILAGPVTGTPGSQEQDVLILDTSIKKRVTCVRFAAGDYKDLQGKLVLGATVGVVYTGFPQETDFEMTCIQPRKWEVRKKGNPTRRDFVVEHRDAIVLKALCGRPETMRHFYGGGLGGFIAVIGEFPEMCETVRGAGADISCPGSN